MKVGLRMKTKFLRLRSPRLPGPATSGYWDLGKGRQHRLLCGDATVAKMRRACWRHSNPRFSW